MNILFLIVVVAVIGAAAGAGAAIYASTRNTINAAHVRRIYKVNATATKTKNTGRIVGGGSSSEYSRRPGRRG